MTKSDEKDYRRVRWLDALIDEILFINVTGRDNGIQCQGIHFIVINGRILSRYDTILHETRSTSVTPVIRLVPFTFDD